MFGLGGGELILILILIVLFFGARKLPEFARGLGRGIRNFKGELNAPPDEDAPPSLPPDDSQGQ